MTSRLPARTRFTHWNARGLRANLPEFLHFLSDFSPSCTFICESFLLDQHRLSVPCHVVYRHDAQAQGTGGFACVVSNSFSSHLSPISLPSSPSFCTAFRVSLSSCSLTVFSVYLRPQSSLQDIDLLESLVASFPPPYLLLGDFNARHPSWGSARSCQRGLRLLNLLDSLNLVSLNSGSPTRFDSHSGNLSHLDLAFISPSLAPLASWEVHQDSLGSDHFPCSVTLFDCPPAPSTQLPGRWILRKADWDLFSSNLDSTLSSSDTPFSGPLDSVYDHLCSSILSAARASIPSSRPRASKRPLVPWWSDACSSAVRAKRRAYRRLRQSSTPANLETYRRLCAVARRTVRLAKRDSWRRFCSSITRDTPLSLLWRRVHSISFNRPRSSGILPALPLDEKARVLSSYFGSPPPPPTSDHSSSTSAHVSDLLTPTCPCTSVLCLPFTLHELDRAIASLRDTAPGEDNIPAALLKHLPLSARLALLHLFNRSWQEGSIPTAWTSSLIIPILKAHKPSDSPSSYRPISLTSVPCKTMERLVLSRLQWFLETSGLLSPFLTGFRPGHSSLHGLLRLEADIRSSFRARHHTLACFLDISQAFDTVWHDGLLLKLLRLSLPLCLIRWIRSFLSHRSAKVKLGSFTSDSFSTCSGTPQGSVLSPTLFNLMVNDLPDILPPQVRISIYADDIVLWTSGKNLPVLGCRLQDALDSLSDWADEWRFTFCAAKSCVVPFSRSLPPTNMSLLINSSPIPNSSSTRHLGLVFDRRLNWSSHSQLLRSSCQQRVNLMRLVSGSDWGADRHSLLLLFKTLVRPVLDYGCPLFLDAPPSFLRTLEGIQARCLRVATGLPSSTPHATLCAETGIMPISVRHRLLSFNFMTRILDRCPSSPVALLLSSFASDVGPSRRHCTPALVIASRLIPSLPVPPLRTPLPLWMFPDPPIFLPPPASRAHLSPAALKAAFLEILHTRFDHCLHIYTDGSYSADTGLTSSSFWDPTHSFAFSQRLPDHLGIFAAELFAIFCALHHVLSRQLTPVVIFSDSLSVLTSLSHVSPCQSQTPLWEQVQLLLFSATCRELQVSLHWVPAHCGVEGNEEADRLASSPTSTSSFPFDPPFTHFRSQARQASLRSWQESWTNCSSSRSFFGIKPTVDPWPHLSFGSRALCRTLSRLRTGHCLLPAHFHLHGSSVSPLCPHCSIPLTVEHFLLACPHFDSLRSIHLRPLLSDVPDSSLTIEFLLRGGSAPFPHHRRIFSAIYSFVSASGLRV